MYVTGCPTLALDLDKLFAAYWLVATTGNIPAAWPDTVATTINAVTPAVVAINGAPGTGAPSKAAPARQPLVTHHGYTVFFSAAPAALCPPQRTFDLDAIQQMLAASTTSACLEVMDYVPAIMFAKPGRYWGDIDTALRAAAFRGVALRLLISHWDYTSPLAMPYLQSLDVLPNITVRLMEIPSACRGPRSRWVRLCCGR